jgi:hypothetical protein
MSAAAKPGPEVEDENLEFRTFPCRAWPCGLLLVIRRPGGGGPRSEPEPESFEPAKVDVVQSGLERNTNPQLSDSERDMFTAGQVNFAVDFYQAVRKQLSADSNVFLSPHSVAIALGMTYAGARGETAAEMKKALRCDLPDDRLHTAFNYLDLALASRGKGDGRLRELVVFGDAASALDEGRSPVPHGDRRSSDEDAPLSRANPRAKGLRSRSRRSRHTNSFGSVTTLRRPHQLAEVGRVRKRRAFDRTPPPRSVHTTAISIGSAGDFNVQMWSTIIWGDGSGNTAASSFRATTPSESDGSELSLGAARHGAPAEVGIGLSGRARVW